MRYSKGWGAALIVMLLLILDQALKIWIKTHMQLHESIEITPWFYLYFTENPGMAFGIEVIGKLFLSVFRIIAVGFIGYYLYKLVKQNYAFGFIACISLIFAGLLGTSSTLYSMGWCSIIVLTGSLIYAGGWRLCQLVARESGRYVLFSFDTDGVARMDSGVGRRGVHLFPSDL